MTAIKYSVLVFIRKQLVLLNNTQKKLNQAYKNTDYGQVLAIYLHFWQNCGSLKFYRIVDFTDYVGYLC